MASDEEAGHLSSLCHFLATPEQLSTSSSQLDGVPLDLESSIRLAGTQLTQAAGILLRLPQDVIAHAIVIFLRFFIGPQGGSVRTYAAQVWSIACALRESPELARDLRTIGCIGGVPLHDGEDFSLSANTSRAVKCLSSYSECPTTSISTIAIVGAG